MIQGSRRPASSRSGRIVQLHRRPQGLRRRVVRVVRVAALTVQVALIALTSSSLLLAPSAGAAAGSQTTVSGTTVPGPTAGSTVTVSQTSNLTNQVVHVSWTGFRPSNPPILTPSTLYPVKVYECTANPSGPKDCYGSSSYAQGPGAGTNYPDGPTNAITTVTGDNGTGSVDIEVRTKKESSTLACSSATACSLAIVPNYGDGDPNDDFLAATQGAIDASWSWANHVSVPLSFAPAADSCPLGAADVTTTGSPAAQRQITQWQPKTCILPKPANVDYTALGEPQARTSFLSGQTDVGLTTLPASTTEKVGATRTFAYAPVGLTGIAIAYRIDDAITEQPITDLKLTPRLLAKLVTESYTYNGSDNPATAGNPNSVFTDPEFLALNPGHAFPTSSGSTPLMLGDSSDMTYELTRWLASDPATKAWLAGAPDEHGMHVNDNYKGVTYPTSTFDLRDAYPKFTYIFAPIAGLSGVARSLVLNQPPGVSPQANPQTGTHDKLSPESIGTRDLIAVVDLADAAAFHFDVASLPNASGAYVQPTDASLTQAQTAMKADSVTGTRQADFASTSPGAYPLTMLEYAMVPTSKLSQKSAAEVGLLLDFAAGPGQTPGVQPGTLPSGYVPLPAGLLAETKAAAAHVRAQDGALKTSTPVPKPKPSRGDQPGSSLGGSTPSDTGSGGGTLGDSGTTGTGGDGSGDGSSAGGTDGGQSGAAAKSSAGRQSAAGSGAGGATTQPVLLHPVASQKTTTERVFTFFLVMLLAATLLGPGYLLWGRRAALTPFARKLRRPSWLRLPGRPAA